jgi:hypothetical protein
MSATFMPRAAETRAKVNTISADQGAIPQPRDRGTLDGAQQLAGLLGGQYWRLALAELLARRFHGERGVVLEHAAGDQVVEEHADGCHVLLQRGGREVVGLGGFEIVAHIEGTDVLYARPTAIFEEGKERAERSAIGPPRIVVVDGGAQEVLDAVARLAAGALDDGGRPSLRWRYNEVLAEHRFPLPPEGTDAAP